MGNRPRRTPKIPNELTTPKTAPEPPPTHSNDPQAWTAEPKVRGSNPLGRAWRNPACEAGSSRLEVSSGARFGRWGNAWGNTTFASR
jgi:hypothetical protein